MRYVTLLTLFVFLNAKMIYGELPKSETKKYDVNATIIKVMRHKWDAGCENGMEHYTVIKTDDLKVYQVPCAYFGKEGERVVANLFYANRL